MRRIQETFVASTTVITSVPASTAIAKVQGGVITIPIQQGQYLRLKVFGADIAESTVSGKIQLTCVHLTMGVILADGSYFEMTLPGVDCPTLPYLFQVAGGVGTFYNKSWLNPGPFFDVPWDMRLATDNNVGQAQSVYFTTYSTVVNTDSVAHSFDQICAVWYSLQQIAPGEENAYQNLDSYYTKPLT